MENITSLNQDNYIADKEQVNILGTNYLIAYKEYTAEPIFKNGVAAFCNTIKKEIILCDILTDPDRGEMSDIEVQGLYKTTLRHEIIHAFLYESGLDSESFSPRAWATNEELIDWIALQSPKFCGIFQKLGIM